MRRPEIYLVMILVWIVPMLQPVSACGGEIITVIENGRIVAPVVRLIGCQIEERSGYLRLSAQGFSSGLQTVREFKPPVVLRLTGRARSQFFNLFYGSGKVLFHGWRGRALGVRDPKTTEFSWIPEAGWLDILEWREIVWEILPDRMRILVDGELRHEVKGDYGNLTEGIAFGPSGTIIDIQNVTIETR